jgi:hypothetical protein
MPMHCVRQCRFPETSDHRDLRHRIRDHLLVLSSRKAVFPCHTPLCSLTYLYDIIYLTQSTLRMVSRFTRLFSLVLGVVVISTLYIFYPSAQSPPPSPNDKPSRYEAGGIDSDHWNPEIKPDFQHEEFGHTRGGNQGGVEHEEVRELDDDNGSWIGGAVVGGGSVDEKILGGGVIMPKLENATAKSVDSGRGHDMLMPSRAELGRAAWLVLHLMTLRYPDVSALLLGARD